MAKQSRISHISDADLANMTAKEIGAQFYNGNTGAGYNAAIARGIRPKAANGEQGNVVTEKKSSAPAKPIAKPATPAKAEVDTLPIPGRVEAYFEYKLNWNMSLSIQPHHIEMLIRCDDVAWNQLALKFGSEEIAMLGAFLESEGYCPVARVSQRGPWYAEQRRLAEQKRIAEAIAAIAAIDARLSNQRERFETSRYDADIAAFYAD